MRQIAQNAQKEIDFLRMREKYRKNTKIVVDFMSRIL